MKNQPILWNPTPELIKDSQMSSYMRWLNAQYQLHFETYQDLHRWSVEHIEDFWESIWKYMNLLCDESYREVLSDSVMPGAHWFEGSRLNFAKNLLNPCILGDQDRIVVVALDEERNRKELTAEGLIDLVINFQNFLKHHDVKAGDRVAGIVNNDEKTLVAMLATTSLGATWASASPDFGPQALIDRLSQIQPKVLFTVNGYAYNGKEYEIGSNIETILKEVPSIQTVVWIPKILKPSKRPKTNVFVWKDIAQKKPKTDLTFVSMPFDHPVYIMFSSGTTGKPKAIVHSAGGILLQHFKELYLHGNVGSSSVMTYYTTCGWMMWNWLVSAMITGARLVLYDGSATYPSIERLWSMIESESITHFGTSAKFLSFCRSNDLSPKRILSMKNLQNIFSTGSPLTEEDYDWVYGNVKKQIQLTSISGGTDILSCFVLGNPISPIYRGEIQCKGLGMDVASFDEKGNEVIDQKGELICKKPAPCMPVYFLNDSDGSLYHEAYFSRFEGVWCHGDYIEFNERGGSQILGRSDTTLNPGGVRIGTSEIYRQVDGLPQIKDSLVTSLARKNDEEIVLLIVLEEGVTMNADLHQKICNHIHKGLSPRHVPKHIFAISGVPYTRSGKKVELAVKNIFHKQEIKNTSSIANVEVLEEIQAIAKELG